MGELALEKLVEQEWASASEDHRRLRGVYFERCGREGGSPSALAERRSLGDMGFEALGRWDALRGGAMGEEALEQLDVLSVALKNAEDGLLWRRLVGLWGGWSARDVVSLLNAFFSFDVGVHPEVMGEVLALCRHESSLVARLAGVWLFRFAEGGEASLEEERRRAEERGDSARAGVLGEVLEMERGGKR